MKVYLAVYAEPHEGVTVLGAFSTKELAEEFVSTNDGNDVLELTVYDSLPPAGTDTRGVFLLGDSTDESWFYKEERDADEA